MSFCLPEARQDLQNAQVTAKTYLYSGVWNPTLIQTEAAKGTLFIGVGSDPTVAGKVWQKQDNGCTTNWTEFAQGSASSSLQYRFLRYVDPVVGNDATADGSINKPYQTIQAALAAITDASSANRYCLVLAPGVYPGAITWKSWVSAQGYGKDVTRLSGLVTHTGAAAETSRMDLIGIQFTGGMTIDHSASFNINCRLIDCLVTTLTYNGGPDYGVTQVNNLFLEGGSTTDLIIQDGAVHAYNNHGVFSTLTIQDGPVANSLPFLEIVGGLLQGAVTLNGKAQLISRGLLNTASIASVVASATTPIWDTDQSSTVPVGNVLNPNALNRVINDEQVFQSALARTLVNEDIALMDATAGALAYTLQPAASRKGKTLKIKNVGTANDVTVTPAAGDTINGQASLVLNPGASVELISNEATDWKSLSREGNIVSLDSAASAGGAATEVLAVAGLLATDTVLAVSQRVKGANNTAVTGFGAPGAGTLSVDYTANPGAGSIVRVLVKRQ